MSVQNPLPGILVIIVTWLFAVALIHPQGNFPLNDDWAYGGAVKSFLDTGSIRLPDWTATNFLGQMFWGALFCLPYGFSFTALRVSTLVLGLIGVLTAYGLFLEIGATCGVALFGALSLGMNPLYLVLSYSYMTDVPFLTFSLLSLYFLLRAMRTNSKKKMAVGLTLACVALLIRQSGLAIFIAAGLAHFTKDRPRARTALISVMPILLGLATQFFFKEWLKFTHAEPVDYGLQVRWVFYICSHMSWRTVVSFIQASIVFLVYLGLFSFPFLIFMGSRKLTSLFRFRSMTFLTLLFGAVMIYFLRDKRLPLLPNYLYDLGLGPALLYDTDTLHLHNLPTAGNSFWTAMTFVGLIGGVFVFQATLVTLVEVFSHKTLASLLRKQAIVLFLATGMIYIAPLIILCFSPEFGFDRYLLPLVPLTTILLVQSSKTPEFGKDSSRFTVPAVVTLVLSGVFSVAGTHDYLSWNRVRWQALNNLMHERHVSPGQIDGGFEFNGLYLYSRSYPNPLPFPGVEPRPRSTKSWWWVASDDFVVTFGPVPGFREVKSYKFRRWLPPGEGSVSILQRTSTYTGTNASTHAVYLSWTKSTSPDVSGYNLYRAAYTNSCGSFSKINSVLTTSTSYKDSQIMNGAAYCYATTTVDTSNVESVFSNIVSNVQIPVF